MKRITVNEGSILLTGDFNNEGTVKSECVEISVQFIENYGRKYLEISGMRPYLMKVIPVNSTKERPFFFVLVFAVSNPLATRFCAKQYLARSVETVDVPSTWVIPRPVDIENIEDVHFRISEEEELSQHEDNNL